MSGGLRNLDFLVVDDNYHMCRIVDSMLRGFGVRDILTVTNVPRALEELNARHFDITIVDYLMQPMDGLEFTQLVRTASDSRNPYLPIILMTSYTERWRMNEAKNAGVNAILAKPLRPVDLYKRLVHVIEKPRDYVKTKNYFGPDRRVDVSGMYEGEERRESQEV